MRSIKVMKPENKMKPVKAGGFLKAFFSPLNSLYMTQFLSSFADNLNFFIIVGIVKNQGLSSVLADRYITNIQIGFLLAYVILAPIVGAYADKNAKSHVLILGNLTKAFGVALLLTGLHPIFCYAILGIGAVIYSPAKYGILTELTHSEDELLRANSKVEGSTILAILLGTVLGGILVKISSLLGISVCLGIYIASLAISLLVPKKAGNPKVHYLQSTRDFFRDFKILFTNTIANFSLIATGSFWLTAAVLRIALIAWLPINLGITDTDQQSMIIGITAVGVIIGALLTPKLVKVGKLYKSYYFGFVMVVAVMIAAFLHSLILTVLFLLLIGFCGGAFLIPMNTLLQEVGKDLVGSGKTIAIQNFVENILTVSGLCIYLFFNAMHVQVSLSVVGIGVILLAFILYLSSRVSKVKKTYL